MTEHNTILSKTVTITNELGLHARPAVLITKIAQKAKNVVWIADGDHRADASSVIDILTINGKKGKSLIIEVEADSDIHILNSIIDCFESGFGENADG